MGKRYCKLLLAGAAILFLLEIPVWADDTRSLKELYLYPTFSYFTWEEFSNGRRILKESGALYGIGGALLEEFLRQETGVLALRLKLELFGGVVNYDGQTQQATNQALSQLPVSTDVAYVGLKTEMDAGWRVFFPNGNIGPLVGIGYRWWLRDLQDSTTSDRNGQPALVGGYTEEWETIYTRLGGHVEYLFPAGWRLFCEGGGRYPLFNRNSADFPGMGRVELEPAKRWSVFAEAGVRAGNFRPAFFYEGMRFGQSDQVALPGRRLALLQPESTSDIFGVSLSYHFK